MQIVVLGSGSSGNSTYVATSKTAILVDLGFGPRSLKRRLTQAGLKSTDLDAILISHGHGDHVSGVPSLLAQRGIPVFMNEGTRQEVPELQSIDVSENFQTGSLFTIGDLQIEAFPIPHDAAEPVGFRFSAEGITGAIVTDLGEMTTSVIGKICGCDWLIIESNHDVELLKIGPYPWHVKERVMSNLGHLSNQEISSFFLHKYDRQASHIFLAHLSRQNNDPEIALHSAYRSLSQKFSLESQACQVHLTYQNHPSELVCY